MSYNWQERGRKLLQDEKHPYRLYSPHSIDITTRNWINDKEWIVVSIDPGLVHLCIRIESRNQVNGQIKTLLFLKVDVYSLYNNSENKCVVQSVSKVYDIFDSHRALFTSCHVWVVEMQLPVNTKSRDLSKHIISWAFINLKNRPNLPLIIEFESRQKYLLLDCPSEYNENAKKKWGESKAIELLNWRKDYEAIRTIENEPTSKKNDLCDTVIIAEALFVYMNWRTTTQPIQIRPIDNSNIPRSYSVPNISLNSHSLDTMLNSSSNISQTQNGITSHSERDLSEGLAKINLNLNFNMDNNPNHDKRYMVYGFVKK